MLQVSLSDLTYEGCHSVWFQDDMETANSRAVERVICVRLYPCRSRLGVVAQSRGGWGSNISVVGSLFLVTDNVIQNTIAISTRTEVRRRTKPGNRLAFVSRGRPIGIIPALELSGRAPIGPILVELPANGGQADLARHDAGASIVYVGAG